MSTDLALLLAMEPPLAFLHHIPLYMALALLHLPIVTHLDLESDDPEPDRERAPSPTPTVPGYVPSTHIHAPDSTHSTPNPLTRPLQIIETVRQLTTEH